MVEESRIARIVSALKAWRVNELAAALLESAGPLAFLGAQAVYSAQPILSSFVPDEDLAVLARLLEDPASVQALAERLVEDS